MVAREAKLVVIRPAHHGEFSRERRRRKLRVGVQPRQHVGERAARGVLARELQLHEGAVGDGVGGGGAVLVRDAQRLFLCLQEHAAGLRAALGVCTVTIDVQSKGARCCPDPLRLG